MYFIVIRVIAARLSILEKRDVTVGSASLATGVNYTFNPNNNNNTAILNHINHTSCRGKEENFRIIGNAKTDGLLCIKETLLIHKNKPKINTNERSTPIYLFE